MAYKVLVVDDSPIIYKMIKRALEPQGFEMLPHAENGKIGLEMIAELKPDIITLDVTMPVMDGLETAARLFERDPDAKVILLSAMGDDNLIQSAKGIGVKYFLSKPINAKELLNLVTTALGIYVPVC